jgi:hypothetical protein
MGPAWSGRDAWRVNWMALAVKACQSQHLEQGGPVGRTSVCKELGFNSMWLVVLALLSGGCGKLPTDPSEAVANRPAPSPSGKYRLVVVDGFNGSIQFGQFLIMTDEKHPRMLFCPREQFRSSARTHFFWDPEDRVWVYSGDVGTFYWVRNGTNLWVKHRYSNGGVRAPEFLRKLKPGEYER